MESIFSFIQAHALQAHWAIFGFFMLAGLNFPISEDLLIIFSAVLASQVVPENTWKLFAAVFLGAYLSDWVVYWIGRMAGPNLQKLPWFGRFFQKEKVEKIGNYYAKYGIWTLLVGRFIPFGVRNCLFVTAGIGKMPFSKFILSDGAACLLSNTTLFSLAYFCGKNISSILKYVNLGIFAAFILGVGGFVYYRRRKAKMR